MRREVFCLTVVGLIILCNVSLAGLTFYTDRTAWEDAVSGNIVTETFNDVTPYYLSDGMNNAGLITIELMNISSSNQFNSIDDSLASPVKVDQTTHFRGGCQMNDPDATIKLHLPYPVIAFGGDFVSTHSTDGLILEIDGIQYDFEQLIPSNTNGDGFWGMIATSAVSTLTIFDPVQNDYPNKIYRFGETFGMDNVSFAEVPEPATLGLLGLASLCLYGRKRSTS